MPFEITVIKRDNKGNPIKKVHHSASNGNSISDFWEKERWRKPKKNRKKKKKVAAREKDGKTAERLLKEINEQQSKN